MNAEQILEGLGGDIRIGQRYYWFTVTYAYIGKLKSLSERCATITDVTIVTSAGGDSDAVSKIVNGKMKPQVCEQPGKDIIIWLQSLTACIPF